MSNSTASFFLAEAVMINGTSLYCMHGSSLGRRALAYRFYVPYTFGKRPTNEVPRPIAYCRCTVVPLSMQVAQATVPYSWSSLTMPMLTNADLCDRLVCRECQKHATWCLSLRRVRPHNFIKC